MQTETKFIATDPKGEKHYRTSKTKKYRYAVFVYGGNAYNTDEHWWVYRWSATEKGAARGEQEAKRDPRTISICIQEVTKQTYKL